MGKTRSHSGISEEKGRRSDFRRTLSQEQILELQDAITEFFNSEKEKIHIERKLFNDEDTPDTKFDMEMKNDDDMDQADWKEEDES